MFKLIAVIFAIINGVPSERPLKVVEYEEKTFESLDACMAFAGADEGLALRRTVNEFVRSQRGAVTVKMGCATEAKEEDNTI